MKKVIIGVILLVVLISIGIYFFVPRVKKVACNYEYQEAQYFLASTTDFLIIDQGTAPDPRTIIVYDLNKCEKVYEGQYSKPFSLADNMVTYWEPTSEEVTNKNCPEHQGYEKNGLGAGIENLITLDLSSLAKTFLNESRCRARQ